MSIFVSDFLFDIFTNIENNNPQKIIDNEIIITVYDSLFIWFPVSYFNNSLSLTLNIVLLLSKYIANCFVTSSVNNGFCDFLTNTPAILE